MPTPITTIIRRATQPKDRPLNILCFCSHERYESGLAKTGHQFYAVRTPYLVKNEWNEKFAPKPDNYHLLPMAVNELKAPPWLSFDLVLSHQRVAQFPIAQQLSQALMIPHISMEHRLPTSEAEVVALYNNVGDMNLWVSEYQREAWGYPDDLGVVNHTGLDIQVFSPDDTVPKEQWALSVVNNWIIRDVFCGFNLWKEVVGFPSPQPLIPHRVLGDTPGLSQPAPDIPTLVDFYRRATVYLNTSLISSLPTTILESMACGTPVVSTGTCLIPKLVIEHGVNGLIGNNVDELRRHTLTLLNNPELAGKLGRAARRTIEEKFSEDRFVRQWNEIFAQAMEMRK